MVTHLLSGRSGGIAFATLLGLTLLPSAAHAFCRTTTADLPPSYNPVQGCFTEGLVLFWRNACVGYSINEAGSRAIPYDEAKRIIDQSFETWMTVRCRDTNEAPGISVSNLGPAACDEVRYNKTAANQNLIVFRDDTWPYRDANSTLGLTTVSFDPDTGEIRDADMEINSTHAVSTTDGAPTNGFDLASIVTHEAGHFFGLAHATNPSATMYSNAKPGSISLRTLTEDDIDGLCAIYPTEKIRSVSSAVSSTETLAATSCDPTPAHGYTAECVGPAISSAAEKSGCSASANSTAPWGVSASIALSAASLLMTRRRKR